MSKSKREKNYNREERRYIDGSPNVAEYRKHKTEKRIRNAFRSNNLEDLLNDQFIYSE